MKQCPVCKTSYPDPSLRFCLADGTPLVEVPDEQATVSRQATMPASDETVELPRAGNMLRFDIPNTAERVPAIARVTEAPSTAPSGRLLKIFVGFAVLAVLAMLAIAAGLFVYMNFNVAKPAENRDGTVAKNTVRSPVPSPTTDEKNDLRDQIANLQKQLDEQKNKKQPANVPVTPITPATMTRSARVDSPGDGFLALRSLPDSELGERIAKIPHGTVISVGACGPVVQPVKRRGRWCQATYEGMSGWVFDAYLLF